MKMTNCLKPMEIEIISMGIDTKIVLTKNIKEIEGVEDCEGNKAINYEYDMVKFTLPSRDNLEDEIKADFDTYFNQAIEIEEEEARKQETTDKVNTLLEGQLVELNEAYFSAINQLSLQVLELQKEIKSLKEVKQNV